MHAVLASLYSLDTHGTAHGVKGGKFRLVSFVLKIGSIVKAGSGEKGYKRPN